MKNSNEGQGRGRTLIVRFVIEIMSDRVELVLKSKKKQQQKKMGEWCDKKKIFQKLAKRLEKI